MGFSGQIEDFSVVDVLQYIHALSKSGVLGFESSPKDASAEIYLKDGYIVRAQMSGMPNIGNLLLKLGNVSREQLDEALKIQRSDDESRPLGVILLAQEILDQKTLMKCLFSQVEWVIVRVMRWEHGVFSFEMGQVEVPDDISASPYDFLDPKLIRTESLLLSAVQTFERKSAAGDWEEDKVVHEGEGGISNVVALILRDGDDDLTTGFCLSLDNFPMEVCVVDSLTEAAAFLKDRKARQNGSCQVIMLASDINPCQVLSLYGIGVRAVLPKLHSDVDDKARLVYRKAIEICLESAAHAVTESEE